MTQMLSLTEAYIAVLHPTLAMIKRQYKVDLPTTGVTIKLIGSDMTTGMLREFVEFILSNNVAVRIYFSDNTIDTDAIPIVEPYLGNNPGVVALYTHFVGRQKPTTARAIQSMLSSLRSQPTDVLVYTGGRTFISTTIGIDILGDDMLSTITTENGDVIMIRLANGVTI